ncbi:RNA polymerase sigma factor [Streptomyces sp. NPDC005917]|uniref:RNA polymerase sigma factor n=1 Tax=unclassified Streptomyces TaxID=2593676 RepID=UPI003409B42E
MRTRVRAGESSAFAELFDSYARAVYNHAFRLTADWSVAEDVMAATFLEAWRLRDRVEPEGGPLRPWLLGIATNTARNQYRSNRRYRAAANAAAAAELSVADHADEVAGRVDDRRRLATALTALAALRRPEREVITLCLGEGLDYEAAAQALGVPVGTVASRLARRLPGRREPGVHAPSLYRGFRGRDRHLPPGAHRGDRRRDLTDISPLLPARWTKPGT